MTTLNVSIAASGDDGHEHPSGSWNGNYVWIGHYDTSDMWGCLRFLNITIPKNATINSATLTITEYQTEGGTYNVYLKVRAQAIDDASAPGSSNYPHNMTLTTAGVDLDVVSTNWVLDQETDVVITSVIQELVNRAGWVSGNDINILIVNDGSTGNNDLLMYDYAQSAAKAASLSIDYTVAAGNPYYAYAQQ